MFVVPFNTTVSRNSQHLSRLIDDSFDRLFGAAVDTSPAARTPSLDVVESDASYTITLDMPGVTKEDVKVAVDGRVVTINAHSQNKEEKKEGDRIVYRERSESRFARRFSLPLEVEQADAVAKLENGVLRLTLPKRVARSASQITIN